MKLVDKLNLLESRKQLLSSRENNNSNIIRKINRNIKKLKGGKQWI